jgi:hypothetical protein
LPLRPNEKVESWLAAIGLADLALLVRALIIQGIYPEAVAEVGHLDDDRLGVEIKEAWFGQAMNRSLGSI